MYIYIENSNLNVENKKIDEKIVEEYQLRFMLKSKFFTGNTYPVFGTNDFLKQLNIVGFSSSKTYNKFLLNAKLKLLKSDLNGDLLLSTVEVFGLLALCSVDTVTLSSNKFEVAVCMTDNVGAIICLLDDANCCSSSCLHDNCLLI